MLRHPCASRPLPETSIALNNELLFHKELLLMTVGIGPCFSFGALNPLRNFISTTQFLVENQ